MVLHVTPVNGLEHVIQAGSVIHYLMGADIGDAARKVMIVLWERMKGVRQIAPIATLRGAVRSAPRLEP